MRVRGAGKTGGGMHGEIAGLREEGGEELEGGCFLPHDEEKEKPGRHELYPETKEREGGGGGGGDRARQERNRRREGESVCAFVWERGDTWKKRNIW